jgi:site-specific DNA-methyltransferase (adenine-specific)
MTQASFNLRGYNPDVLNCIANLSSDQVFTPPEFANRMLDSLGEVWANSNDGKSIWANKDVTFLDPCTKSGVFLREIAQRLTHGLKIEFPDLAERVNHILTKQVYGIATETITSLISRRSIYCSKDANGIHSIARTFENSKGNIWFERVEHTWLNTKCSYCGANERDYSRGSELETYAYAFIHSDNIHEYLNRIFGGEMRFDVVIGNPPYQLGQSGGESVGGFAMPIYQKFVQAAKGIDPNYVIMVTPSRWFAGGRGLDEYRKEMLNDSKMRKLVDFTYASEVFPGNKIEGGVSYFLWDNTWNGECEVSTVEAGEATTEPMSRKLGEFDILVRRNEALSILKKVLNSEAKEKFIPLDKKVSPIQPFSIRTDFRGALSPKGIKDPIRLIGNGEDTYIRRSEVPRNTNWIDEWKVLIGRAYGIGSTLPQKVFNNPIVAGPGTACSETYLVIGRFPTEDLANYLSIYLQTRFVRFLVSLRKNTQDIYSERFSFVPDLPMNKKWTDDILYKKYGITPKEIDFIESMIRPMVLSDE